MILFPPEYFWPRLAALLALVLFSYGWFCLQQTLEVPPKTRPKRLPRPLKPSTPNDCPECVGPVLPDASPTDPPVRPWRDVKSKRGRPKSVDTEGYACHYWKCKYRGITDSSVHALVGYGHHGANLDIQDFYCEACEHKFSARRHTALYRLKSAAARVALALASVAEGLSIDATVRVLGISEGTLSTWLTRAGMHCERLHRQKFKGLHLVHIQLDELYTTLRNKGQAVWLWLALDAQTKIIAAVQLGPRTQPTAHALIHALVQVLAPGCIPLFTSDGLNLYFYGLTAHFGAWVETLGAKKREWQVAATLVYGQLIKSYRRRKLARVERVIRWGSAETLKARLQQAGWSGLVQTAFVERVNLTVRRGLAMFARRSWATTQTLSQLKDGFAWWRGYYHFVKPHAGLRVKLAVPRERGGKRLPQSYRKRTPAMAAGVSDHRWTVVELLSCPVLA